MIRNKLNKIPGLLLLVLAAVATTLKAQVQRSDTITIQSLIQDKKSRTPLEQKIDSRLLQAVRQMQTRGTSAEAPGGTHADKQGNVNVDISADVSDVLLANIEKLGGKIIFPSKKYRTVRATVNLSAVKTIAGYPEVKFIKPASIAVTNAGTANSNLHNSSTGSPSPGTIPPPSARKDSTNN